MDTQHFAPRWLTGLAAAALITGGGVMWWTIQHTPVAPPLGASTSSPTNPAQTLTPPVVAQQTTVYWLAAQGQRLELTAQTIELTAADTPEAVLTATFTALLSGPAATDGVTTIPPATTLLDLAVATDGVHVNLSRHFVTGGGSASMSGRLGQVIYTATSLDPDAPVWIAVEGEPLTLLGGEGLAVQQPMTRSQFAADFAL